MEQRHFEMLTERSDLATKSPVKMWTRGVPVGDTAMQQIVNIASMPFIHSHVAVMPDVHWGMGATVGSVIATKGAIIPAAVGVDIGCGMVACRTDLTASDLPDNLLAIRTAIEAAVPHGRTDNGGVNDRGAWGDERQSEVMKQNGLARDLALVSAKYPKRLERPVQRSPYHLGTLGTGNHFIEICLDETDAVWAMLHSGSRGIGNAIGQHFIELAKEDMRRWFINLPDVDLAYLPEGTQHFEDYMQAVGVAQRFASVNRETMMVSVIRALRSQITKPFNASVTAVNCHHNYVTRERHFGQNVLLTRKGAVRAKLGDLGIIPGSMGTRSYIVRGKGNRDSFCSCSHGAGRKMSRGEARRTFTLSDHAAAVFGVECRVDEDVIDETPGAYKDIDAVMEAQMDLVDIVHTLRQIVCVKG
jgi:tRNA-splicing ligase RtcB